MPGVHRVPGRRCFRANRGNGRIPRGCSRRRNGAPCRTVVGATFRLLENCERRDAPGEGWHSGGTVVVYRQYNRYATTGTHNYTTDKNENDTLVANGWTEEGIGWYALGEGWPVETPSEPSPEPSQPQQPSEPAQPSEPQESVVYWTPGGETWHSTRNCPSLKRSKNIISGTVEQAKAAHKNRPCANCH